jgi:hypothetical protein
MKSVHVKSVNGNMKLVTKTSVRLGAPIGGPRLNLEARGLAWIPNKSGKPVEIPPGFQLCKNIESWISTGKPGKDAPSFYGECVRPVKNLHYMDGMYQPAQTFVNGNLGLPCKPGEAFTVWLSQWTSEQFPDGPMVMKKDGGRLTFVSPMTDDATPPGLE